MGARPRRPSRSCCNRGDIAHEFALSGQVETLINCEDTLLNMSIDEEVQATCLRWMAEFLLFVKNTMVAFTPRLIPVILASLAHHVPAIRSAALQTNYNLFKTVQQLPSPPTPIVQPEPQLKASPPSHRNDLGHNRKESGTNLRINPGTKTDNVPFPMASPLTAQLIPSGQGQSSRLPSQERMQNLDSLVSDITISQQDTAPDAPSPPDELDYQATVNALTIQFLNENEETRVAALQWLSMLHQKAPKKVSLRRATGGCAYLDGLDSFDA